MDVILENHRLLKKLKVKLEPTHVLGHQDRVKEWHELTKMEKLNVRMDKLAEDFLIDPPEHLLPQPYPLLFPAQQICIKMNEHVLAANMHNELVYGEKEVIIRHYFVKQFGIPEQMLDSIDWRCFAYVMNKNKQKKQILKSLHHLWNTQKITFRWNKSKCDKCPLCHAQTETWQHVLQCNNEHIVRARTEFLTTLDRGLTAMHTEPGLQKWILCGLRSWLSLNEIGEPAKYDIINVDVHESYCAQKAVGFDPFIQGLIVRDFQIIQDKYYKASNYPVKYNGIRWTKYVMTSLMEFSHNMWKERCALVTAGTNAIHERRMRTAAWEKLQSIKRDTWKIPSVCRDILRRDNFFL